jgi:hypothetical protein
LAAAQSFGAITAAPTHSYEFQHMIIFSSVICLFAGNVAGMESPLDI